MLEYNMRTFGKVATGVHGSELPKFAESRETQEYWVLANPGSYTRSKTQAKENRRHIRAASLDGESIRILSKPRRVERPVAGKITETRYFGEKHETRERAKCNPRWTSTIETYMPKSKYNENRQSAIRKENEPLYSSFGSKNIFIDNTKKCKT
eukprot:TRINITY_DN7976_c0_g1_i4.p2 TRINITY_DN7976_c0_g1~~TRINITY_DN7976_c0_g1_i4.p2  ORF type:complete len:153 (+),score=24.82 TRINITY_DN7976_c0_g1_i4:881-1339(+)